MRLRPDQAQELEAVCDRHPHVQDDRIGGDAVGDLHAGLGGHGRGDFEPFELEDPREGIGYGSVVVYDEDGPRG